METFINSAKDGFIFVSFGTGVDFNLIGGDVQDQFIAGLAALPKMKFLWKNSVPIKKSLPSNVLVVKWAPQQTILGDIHYFEVLQMQYITSTSLISYFIDTNRTSKNQSVYHPLWNGLYYRIDSFRGPCSTHSNDG